MADIERQVANFLASYRGYRAKQAGKTCVECGERSETYCESCGSGLCYEHADTTTYYDVDVCADKAGCEKRCADFGRGTQ